MPVVAIAEITHLSKHDTVAGEGLAICPHMSSYVSVCPELVKRRTTHLSKHNSKML